MKTALIMLAAGMSARFGGDKLLAPLHGAPLGARAAELWRGRPGVLRLAIVPFGSHERRVLFEGAGWTVLDNDDPSRGQSSSLGIGVRAAKALSCDAAVISLADMPFVDDAHLDGLVNALHGAEAVMSAAGDVLMPPAAFAADTFEGLQTLNGDRGAKAIFTGLQRTATLAMTAGAARDVDTFEALMALNSERANDA